MIINFLNIIDTPEQYAKLIASTNQTSCQSISIGDQVEINHCLYKVEIKTWRDPQLDAGINFYVTEFHFSGQVDPV